MVFNEGAYLYKKGQNEIQEKDVINLFSAVKKNEKDIKVEIYRHKELIKGAKYSEEAMCSLLVFRYTNLPNFIRTEDFNDKLLKFLKEEKIAYLLLIEMKDYLIILKKNVSGISDFLKDKIVVDSQTLITSFTDQDVKFQKVKVSSMNINASAIRNKTLEADKLQDTMSMFGSNRNILSNVRLAGGEGICSINVSTSRIAKIGNKKNIPELIVAFDDVISNIVDIKNINQFVARFAYSQQWSRHYKDLFPVSLLIDKFSLQDYIRTRLDNDSTLYRLSKDGNYYKSMISWTNLINGIDCWNIEGNDGTYFCSNSKNRIEIKTKKNGIGIKLNGGLDNLYYEEKGEVNTKRKVSDILSCGVDYIIGFNKYEYAYIGRRLYKNNDILSDFNAVLSVFIPIQDLNIIKSEKGYGYTMKSTNFKKNSLFYAVEQEFKNARYLICDDMGNEWADHIAIRETTISFIHSKHKEKVGLSASSFQEVIGQAIKNIGHLMPDDDSLESKRVSFSGKWSDNGQTGINRCRIGDVDSFIDTFKQLRVNPNLRKEICLAVDFISFKEIESAFNKIRDNQPLQQKYSVIQLVWLISSFISICKEADIYCKIYCLR